MRSYYIDRKPTGNVFVEFCSASWAGFKEKCCGSQEKQPHFLDYAIAKGHTPEIVRIELVTYPNFRLKIGFWGKNGFRKAFERDGKYVYPIIIMFTPLPFFWALFDMQGSRWTLTATQMNGWQGHGCPDRKSDSLTGPNCRGRSVINSRSEYLWKRRWCFQSLTWSSSNYESDYDSFIPPIISKNHISCVWMVWNQSQGSPNLNQLRKTKLRVLNGWSRSGDGWIPF